MKEKRQGLRRTVYYNEKKWFKTYSRLGINRKMKGKRWGLPQTLEKNYGKKDGFESNKRKKWGFERTVDQELIKE